MRAALVGGTYLIEENGSAGGHSGCGIGNGQGPTETLISVANSTVMTCTFRVQPTPSNEETFIGSAVANPSLADIYLNVFNPFATWSAGTVAYAARDAGA